MDDVSGDGLVFDQIRIDSNASLTGGLFGTVKNSGSLGSVSIKRSSVSGGTQTGLMIGSVSNGPVELSSIDIEQSKVTGSGSVGGLVGTLVHPKEKESKIEKIITDNLSIASSNNTVSYFGGGILGDFTNGKIVIKDVRHDKLTLNGRNMGGIVGRLNNAEAQVAKINNHVTAQNFSDSVKCLYASGLVSKIEGSATLKVEDVIHRAVLNCSNSAGLIDDAQGQADVKNVINDVEFSANSAGDVSGVIRNFVGGGTIEGVISRAKITGLENNNINGAGFVHTLKGKNADHKSNILNVLNKSDIQLKKGDVAGFIFDMSTHANIEKVTNILTASESFLDGAFVQKNNVVKGYTQSGGRCDGGTQENYGANGKTKEKSTIRSIFSNAYYVTPGEESDPNVEKLLALTRCGTSNGYTNMTENDETAQCIYHRDYKFPVSDCWFTDFIYQEGHDWSTSEPLKPENIPIKPYHYYSQKMKPGADYNVHALKYPVSPDGTPNMSKGNAAEVKTALPEWKKCSDTSLINLVDKPEDFDHLLCPPLNGELTCMGTFNAGVCTL